MIDISTKIMLFFLSLDATQGRVHGATSKDRIHYSAVTDLTREAYSYIKSKRPQHGQDGQIYFIIIKMTTILVFVRREI